MILKRPQKLNNNINIKAINRPIKIAYLVPHEESTDNHLILDAVFYESYTRWAGVRTLIVPTDTNKFSNNTYEEWLNIYDPDFIYVYIDLEKEFIEKLNVLCCPIGFIKHEIRRVGDTPSWKWYKPNLESYPYAVPSITTIHSPYANYKRHFEIDHTSIVTVLTQFRDVSENRIFADNFGTAFKKDSICYPISELCQTLCLTPSELDERTYVGTNRTSSINEIIEAIAQKKAIPISKLAIAHSQSINRVESRKWTETFNLFVGRGCLDRIHFWNARNIASDYIDIPSSLITNIELYEDPEFVTQLGNMLNKHNFLGQGNGQPKVEIRSHTHSKEELAPIKDKLNDATYNSVFLTDGYNLPARPSNDEIKEMFPRESTDKKIYKIDEDIVQVQADKPEHFEYITPKFQSHKEGAWAIELEIERHNNLSIYSNYIDIWMVPRRHKTANVFTRNLAKISRRHHLVIIPSVESHGFGHDDINKKYTYEIILPDDETVFRSLIHYKNSYFHGDMRSSLEENSYEYLRISDKGQNLRGVISMFDSLNEAFDSLTNIFWRNVLRGWENSSTLSLNKFNTFTPYNKKAKEKLKETPTFKEQVQQ